MSLTGDFKASVKAYKDFRDSHAKKALDDVTIVCQGLSHRVEQHEAEIEDLRKAIEAIEAKHEALINRLKAKFEKLTVGPVDDR